MPVRPITLDDVPALTEQLRLNREFLAPYEPTRDETFFTDAGQAAIVTRHLAQRAAGTTAPFVIDDDGVIVGRITISEIVRGPVQSGSLGYWVAESSNGRGLATAAVADVLRIAFGELDLHSIQAGTLVHNVRSQRVLERNGFTRVGVVPQHLRIAGTWQDHVLFQALAPSLRQ